MHSFSLHLHHLLLLTNLLSLVSNTVFASSPDSPPDVQIEGFSTPLIHRHSPTSPLRDPNFTIFDAGAAGGARAEYLQSQLSWPDRRDSFLVPMRYAHAMYLMVVYVGSSLAQRFLDIDTGSSFVWIQCDPCNYCGDGARPPFDPTESLTYRRLPCSSLCAGQAELRCVNGGDSCIFLMSYVDGTQVFGAVAAETIHTPTLVPGVFHNLTDVVLGCAHFDWHNASHRDEMDGVAGLGRGPLSLVSQLPAARFSYCLSPPTKDTQLYQPHDSIRFGTEARLLGGSSPAAQPWSRHYRLALQGISVGATRLAIPAGAFDGDNTVILDSGASLTLLHPDGYGPLAAALDEAVHLERFPNPYLRNCYLGRLEDVAEVRVTFHFRELDVEVSMWGLFLDEGGFVCSSVQPDSRVSVFGMRTQINHNVGFDVEKNQVWFHPMDCTTS